MKSLQRRNQYWRHREMPGRWPTVNSNYLGTFPTWRTGVDDDSQKKELILSFLKEEKKIDSNAICDVITWFMLKSGVDMKARKKETVKMIFLPSPPPSPLIVILFTQLAYSSKKLLETKLFHET